MQLGLDKNSKICNFCSLAAQTLPDFCRSCQNVVNIFEREWRKKRAVA